MVKWEIIDGKKAKKLHIKVNDIGILEVNLKHIPVNMTIEEFIHYIKDNGIAFQYKD